MSLCLRLSLPLLPLCLCLPVAVIWGGPDSCQQITLKHVLDALCNQLVRTAHKVHSVVVVKLSPQKEEEGQLALRCETVRALVCGGALHFSASVCACVCAPSVQQQQQRQPLAQDALPPL